MIGGSEGLGVQSTLVEGASVAKKAGRPKKPGGEGKPVRIEPELANKARVIALRRGVPLSDYLSDLLRPLIARDYRKTLQELEEENGSAKG
jgi:hypothetical protein